MGACMLVNYLIEEGENTPLTAAFALSCFFNSQKALDHFKGAFFGIYDRLLAFIIKMDQRKTIEQIDKLNEKHPEKQVLKKFENMQTVSFGYSEINAIVNGFESMGHYFARGRLDLHLDKIKIPTFFFNSEDD